jgi:hypothetical protein
MCAELPTVGRGLSDNPLLLHGMEGRKPRDRNATLTPDRYIDQGHQHIVVRCHFIQFDRRIGRGAQSAISYIWTLQPIGQHMDLLRPNEQKR